MNLLQRTLVATVLFAVSGVASARLAEVTDPDPVAVPAGMEQAKLVKAIKLAVLARKWQVTKEEPGYLEVTLNHRKHMLKYGINYGRKEIKFKYLDSAELNYREKDGRRLIHGNANKWVAKLRNDIDRQLLQ